MGAAGPIGRTRGAGATNALAPAPRAIARCGPMLHRGELSCEARLEVPPDGRPLAVDDAEHHGIAPAAVGKELVVAQHAVLLRPEARDRLARSEIEPVGAKLDRDAGERLERMTEEQELALGVDRRAPRALQAPRVPDCQIM